MPLITQEGHPIHFLSPHPPRTLAAAPNLEVGAEALNPEDPATTLFIKANTLGDLWHQALYQTHPQTFS